MTQYINYTICPPAVSTNEIFRKKLVHLTCIVHVPLPIEGFQSLVVSVPPKFLLDKIML